MNRKQKVKNPTPKEMKKMEKEIKEKNLKELREKNDDDR